MSEDAFCRRIMRERYRRSFVLPRYTPARWWECDVFEITEAGYFREYEVKLTLQDFKADQKKDRDIIPEGVTFPIRPDGGWPKETKHHLLANGCTSGPAQFYFVTPPGLLTLDQLPFWAGLIEILDNGADIEIKRAPRLHGQKVAETVRQHAAGITYWRFHNMFQEAA